MLQKTVGCWSYSIWKKITLFYEPLEKRGILPEDHPAVKEDAWFAEPDIILTNQSRKGRKHGYTRGVIVGYLRRNGPAKVSAIAAGIQGKPTLITETLRRNPDVFVVVDYEIIKSSKAAIWKLRDSTDFQQD